ncbi:hypothetical protein [Dactylosporangium sp. CS-033363]|uniref:hypothetical protein n=1 Tax=unclassified Dactylosporangium TaxID=2621675 RepID=UPI003D8C178D
MLLGLLLATLLVGVVSGVSLLRSALHRRATRPDRDLLRAGQDEPATSPVAAFDRAVGRTAWTRV